MFSAVSWANAFINTLEESGSKIDEGIETIKVLAAWTKSLPGLHAGKNAVVKLEPLIRRGLTALNNGDVFSAAQETALRFVLLLVRKNALRHFDSFIREAKNILNRKRSVITASLEYAFEPDAKFKALLNDKIRTSTGASEVKLEERLNPKLLGGYRLQVGDRIIDASIGFQLQKLKTALLCCAQTDNGGY